MLTFQFYIYFKKMPILLLRVFLSQHYFKDMKTLQKVVDSEPTPSMYMFCLQLSLPVTYPSFHKCHF